VCVWGGVSLYMCVRTCMPKMCVYVHVYMLGQVSISFGTKQHAQVYVLIFWAIVCIQKGITLRASFDLFSWILSESHMMGHCVDHLGIELIEWSYGSRTV
jgi:hypothetical protein